MPASWKACRLCLIYSCFCPKTMYEGLSNDSHWSGCQNMRKVIVFLQRFLWEWWAVECASNEASLLLAKWNHYLSRVTLMAPRIHLLQDIPLGSTRWSAVYLSCELLKVPLSGTLTSHTHCKSVTIQLSWSKHTLHLLASRLSERLPPDQPSVAVWTSAFPM